MSKKSKAQKKKINFEDPADDVVETTATSVDEVEMNATADEFPEDVPDETTQANDDSNGAFSETKEKVKIEFPFSDLIRAKIPKFFDVAEVAATQWKNNEKFENLGVSHPVAEIALAKALEKAKDVEKKLEEKGVISAAKMGIAVAKFQAQDLLKKFKKNE